jgi:membrane-associated protease RseP (regulator of RpoE activity)
MMKRIPVLIVMLVFAGWSASAQSTNTTVEKKTNRITITTTKVDESGKPVTETWIAEGEQPELILQGMAVNPDILQKVEAEQGAQQADEERLFLFRHAGDDVVLEGKLSENVTAITPEGPSDGEPHTVIIRKDLGNGQMECKKISTWSSDAQHAKAYYLVNEHGAEPDRKPNCAALGVYVHDDGESMGCHIKSLIDQGGAQEAGLQEGDNILKIDEFDVSDYSTLYLALSHFMPGDVVTVKYDREGKTAKTKVNLKSWSDLPTHAWRARSDCDKPEVVKEDPVPQQDLNIPAGTSVLQLENASVFPNPTEGLFSLSFTTVPGQLSVTVADVNGKVVYQEENENSTGFYNREIDLKDAPAGNYILSVKQGDKVFTQQLSKQ